MDNDMSLANLFFRCKVKPHWPRVLAAKGPAPVRSQ
ncbi:hypothetical protein FHS09_002093 [Microbulbifer rhizosphaerae]|uniref:Uncharacterized protein n=1 Tax=Microbulbifer rhizosphaerae TaxID=1562603 RepID=A0A7W4WBJ6_9GAMM|nr:hypothetical protein [Microbulbifer rhizosphaerae]